MGLEEARDKLELACDHLERVQVNWEDEPEQAIHWAFYTYENAIVAAAEALEWAWERNHFRKADLAQRLHQEGHLQINAREIHLDLNERRKVVQYGEAGPLLDDMDLEDMTIELEQYIDEVRALIEEAG